MIIAGNRREIGVKPFAFRAGEPIEPYTAKEIAKAAKNRELLF